MLIITVFYNDGKWQITRNDRDGIVFTNYSFIITCETAFKWSVWEKAEMIIINKSGNKIGEINFFLFDTDNDINMENK